MLKKKKKNAIKVAFSLLRQKINISTAINHSYRSRLSTSLLPVHVDAVARVSPQESFASGMVSDVPQSTTS